MSPPTDGARRELECIQAAATLAQGDASMAAHADAALAVLRHSPVKEVRRLPDDHDKENAAHRNARSPARAADDEETRLQGAWDVIRKVGVRMLL